MDCYGDDTDERTGRITPAPREPPARLDWRALCEWAAMAALLGLVAMGAWALTGCAPMPGPGGPRMALPSPETPIASVTTSAQAIPPELDRVTAAGETIRKEVAAMVPTLREIQTVAPQPAKRVEAGHQTIYAAANDAQAAAIEARAQVGVVQASAANATVELDKLRVAHQREVEALGQQMEALRQEVDRLEKESASFLQTIARWGMIGAGVAIAAGVGLFFLRMGIAIPLSVIGFGITLLALSALLHRIAGWIVPVAGAIAGLGVVAAVVYGIRHWQAVSRAGVRHADAIKAGVRDAVKTDGLAASHVADALKAVKEEAIKNTPEAVQRTIWDLRPF